MKRYLLLIALFFSLATHAQKRTSHRPCNPYNYMPKTEHVNGYMTKRGTYVQPYFRRPKRY